MKFHSEEKVLSVGILTFNRANFLDELFQSLTTNSTTTLGKIEILVLDNGSTDETSNIIQKYANRLDIKKQKQEINIIGSIRYKELIEMSEGKFIIFPGDDDIFMPNVLDEIIINLEKTPTNITLLPAKAEVINKEKELLRINYEPNNHENTSQNLAELIEKSIYWMPATIIRTSAIKGLVSPNSIIAFDWYLWILTVTKGETKLLPQKIIKYRQHSEKIQNSTLQINWDIDELNMFIFAIQKGAIHDWISSCSESELKHLFNHLNKITIGNKNRFVSELKYILLVQEIARYPKHQVLLDQLKVSSLDFINPRFQQTILGYSLNWRAFKDIFQKLGYEFEIDSKVSGHYNGVYIYRNERKFLLKIYIQNSLIFDEVLNENELTHRIFDFYDEITRDIRNSEVNDQITKFEWKVVNFIRKIKKLRYGKILRIRLGK